MTPPNSASAYRFTLSSVFGIKGERQAPVAPQYSDSPYLFQTERQGPMTDRTARHIIARAGEVAGLPFSVHPHMLRHATGYYLASNGQDTRAIQAYLRHKNIQHTVRYTELSPGRFKEFWTD